MKIKKILSIMLIILVSSAICYTLAEVLDNDVEVETNSELIYYLNVKYDGIDALGYSSSDARLSEVSSNTIYVEDKIPEGLTFTGFVTTDSGSMGAVERNNPNVSCLGNVINDTNEEGNEGAWINNNQEFVYHGLHYNASSRVVSFNVENLKAGCVLTIGIKTRTPATVDDPNTLEVEKRRDFYNFASVSENLITSFSNIVHVYMGINVNDFYSVSYEYDEGTSSLAPSLPPTVLYPKGSIVNISTDMNFPGYTFDGWTSNDVEITNNQFVMPDNDVVIKGSFSAVPSHTVTYLISGNKPSEFLLPISKNYYPNTIVNVDSLSAGEDFNGYTFNGWTSNDVVITNGTFSMPNSDVTITGSFSEISYDVTYKFQGDVIPPNSETLLPLTRSYIPGDVVVLQSISDTVGYKFLGWYHEDGFTMPNEDVTIYGEWKRFNGTFEPSITITDISNRQYYKIGDIINYKVTVTNNENYPIKNILLKENLTDSVFVSKNGYTISNTMAIIDEIGANSSFDVYAQYEVKETDSNTITNSVEIKGGYSDNYYELKDGDYIASITSNLQPKIKVCANVIGSNVGNYFQVRIFNNDHEYWANLSPSDCNIINVIPGTYKIFEITPQEYYINSITGDINENNSNLVISAGSNYEVNFNNKFKSKKFIHAFGRINDILQGGE